MGDPKLQKIEDTKTHVHAESEIHGEVWKWLHEEMGHVKPLNEPNNASQPPTSVQFRSTKHNDQRTRLI